MPSMGPKRGVEVYAPSPSVRWGIAAECVSHPSYAPPQRPGSGRETGRGSSRLTLIPHPVRTSDRQRQLNSLAVYQHPSQSKMMRSGWIIARLKVSPI